MFFQWLLSLISEMLHLLGLGPRARTLTDSGLLQVFIQTNKGTRVTLSLDPKWSIADVKKRLSTVLLLPCQQIRIILAGHELGDEVLVSDCDIGQQSVIHAIQVDVSPTGEEQKPLNQSLLDLQLSPEEKVLLTTPEERLRHRAHFFVYCNSPCRSMQPGKLRVRCSSCLEGAVVVEKEPSDWKDVLEPGKILGRCQTCEAVLPVTFYFKCAAHTPSLEETSPLYLVKSNLHHVPCLACMEECDPVIVFECADRHVICVECFKAYCLSKLNERQFMLDMDYGYTLSCAVGCENSIIREARHFKLIGDNEYERYQRFGTEECVLQSGGVLCPQPQCGMGIIPDEPCRKVTCERGCGYVFCRECLQGFHIGECQAAPCGGAQGGSVASYGGANQARWIDSSDPSSMTIRLMTKPCPKCRTATERDGGCMHMICTKAACGFHWCWICQTEWTRECMASHWFG